MTGVSKDRFSRVVELSGRQPKDLAAEIGISLQYFCDIRGGHRTLKRSPDLVERIAHVLDVPVDWIQHPVGVR